jgi:hypothetical protein
MRKKLFLLILLGVILSLFLIDVFNTGNRHIVVVDENVALTDENGKLKNENKKLVSENSSLKNENEKLNSEISKVSSQMYSIETAIKQKESSILPKTIVKIENYVEAEMGWTTPELAYELLKDKLGRNPTKDEYKKTLYDLESKDMLYEAGNPDPYTKGNKITKRYIDNI